MGQWAFSEHAGVNEVQWDFVWTLDISLNHRQYILALDINVLQIACQHISDKQLIFVSLTVQSLGAVA